MAGPLEKTTQSTLDATEAIEFNIQTYKLFKELPLNVLHKLPFPIYVVDYNWKYLFINSKGRDIFGDSADNLIGVSALAFFSEAKFKPVFDKIKAGLETRITCDVTLYSPLRGRQVRIKGYPLEDCYYFCSIIVPGKDEIIAELRTELKSRMYN